MAANLKECSVGRYLSQEVDCHKTTYNRRTDLVLLQTYNTHTMKLLRIRTEISELCEKDTICLHHEQLFIHKFEHLQTKCCDPFQKRAKLIRKNLRAVSMEWADTIKSKLGIKVLPGWKLCRQCYGIIDEPLQSGCEKEPALPTEDEAGEQDTDLLQSSADLVDESLVAMGCSPMKLTKLNQAQRLKRGKRKLAEASKTLEGAMATALGAEPEILQSANKTEHECQACKDLESLVTNLKRSVQQPLHRKRCSF